jgi:S1-C subfamily serine protease
MNVTNKSFPWRAATSVPSCCVLVGFLGLVASPLRTTAQEATDGTSRVEAPAYVKQQIVQIVAFKPRFPGGPVTAENGAGIIVGADPSWVYVATARHVLVPALSPTETADSVKVRFSVGAKLLLATIDTLAPQPESGTAPLDLGVIRIPRSKADANGFDPVWDRMGDSGALRPGDEVVPVGCPAGGCWRTSPSPDRVLSTSLIEIVFQKDNVAGGSSGGGLFDEWGEVVGMILQDEALGVRALPIDFVVQTLRQWDRPVVIQRPRIPRRGYDVTVGFSMLAATSGGPFPDGRVPSMRGTLVLSVRNWLRASVGVLRLAPDQLGNSCPRKAEDSDPLGTVIGLRDRRPCEQVVHALMVGLTAPIRAGPLLVSPFAELGIGRARGRYDIGGAYQAGDLTYVPNFKAIEQTGFGVGIGVTFEFTILPRAILQGTVGSWNFQNPFEGEDLPAGFDPVAPSLFTGIGIRIGL